MGSGNLLFLLVLFLGPLISLSSSNWVVCWVGLELSFFGAIPLMLMDSEYMSLSKESVIKYFCIQAMGSGLLMIGGMMYYISYFSSWFWDVLFIGSLFVKLGVFPMHFWVPGVVAGLNWFPMFIVLTWQKIGPFAFLVNILENSAWVQETVLALGSMSALVGAIIGLNQTSVRAMLGGSSVAHTGWGLVGATLGGLWIFFLIYCFSFGLLMVFFVLGEDLMISFGVLSLSGLPPFLMFIGKWSVLKGFLFNDFSWLFVPILILGAFLSLFFYLKFFYSYYLKFLYSETDNKKLFGASSLALFSMLGSMYLFFL
uniref:NADH dehydrogenase subunit 2 n=1 Tax=Hypselodoris whitei TaxID=508163 RepID=UPI002A81925C|nr:NADH dehydrogenase subunit 2 [Hypselodoris whitei]WOK01435.1 NADH dehydrogenase subunit 2 [Hypselodoris whitei]